jgi:REP element-mobilizing transposase RayT
MADHPNRKVIRLQQFDYSSLGAYFLTVCTHERKCILSEISETGEVILLPAGAELHQQILNTSRVRGDVIVDEYVIMPNHLHIILLIVSATTDDVYNKFSKPKASSVSSIIGNIKSYASREIRKLPGFADQEIWQRKFHDRVIRNERELQYYRQYIRDNPGQWLEDVENPINWKKRLSIKKL